MPGRPTPRLLSSAACALALVAMLGCAGHARLGKSFQFFGPARADDPFYPKVTDWQRRSARDAEPSDVMASLRASEIEDDGPFGVLYEKFDRFLVGHKRALAREFTKWSQRQARLHWRPDPDTTLVGDHWPTLREFFSNNGDDCDGLDLIAYALLREAGFRPDETYRMVVRRERDGANHMVTLWFEDRDDPWVIDATGAMSMEMVRFSELPPGWLPRVMFNENEAYNVVRRPASSIEVARGADDAPGADASR
jgi:hypothetical protein